MGYIVVPNKGIEQAFFGETGRLWYISVYFNLNLISNVLLVLILNFMVQKSSNIKFSMVSSENLSFIYNLIHIPSKFQTEKSNERLLYLALCLQP